MPHAEMGLHLCYDLHLPGTISPAEAGRLITALHDRARALPFDQVSDIVSVDETTSGMSEVSIGWTYRRLEEVALYCVSSMRADLYRARVGVAPDDFQTRVDLPDDVPVMALLLQNAVRFGRERRSSAPLSLFGCGAH